MPPRVQIPRRSTAEWTRLNPKLHFGEPGYDEGTGLLKIGDGQTRWLDLPGVETGGGGSAGPPQLAVLRADTEVAAGSGVPAYDADSVLGIDEIGVRFATGPLAGYLLLPEGDYTAGLTFEGASGGLSDDELLISFSLGLARLAWTAAEGALKPQQFLVASVGNKVTFATGSLACSFRSGEDMVGFTDVGGLLDGEFLAIRPALISNIIAVSALETDPFVPAAPNLHHDFTANGVTLTLRRTPLA